MTIASQLSATSLLSDFISVLRTTATSMLCCNNIDGIKPNSGWWDNEYKIAEHNKVLSLRKFRLSNSYADLLEYKARKKKFKSLCKYKISYQRKRKMDLIKSRKDPKKFWGIIKTENTGCRSNYPIPPEQWLVHFKKLLNHETERNVTYTMENSLHHFTI